MKQDRKRKAAREAANGPAAKRIGTLPPAVPVARSAFSVKPRPAGTITHEQPERISLGPHHVPVKQRGPTRRSGRIPQPDALNSVGQASASQTSSSTSGSESDEDDANSLRRENVALRYSHTDLAQGDILKVIPESEYPRNWKRAREVIAEHLLKETQQQSIVQILGVTSAGKSTFAKYLLKSVLFPPEHLSYDYDAWEKVLMLDLDPTKSEFSLPGHISLVSISNTVPSANFCSGAARLDPQQKVLRSHAVGLTGHQDDPEYYLAAVADLVNTHRHESEQSPVIVCCPSFEREAERGMNGRTTVELSRLIHASHVCCLAQSVAHTIEAIQHVKSAITSHAKLWELDSIKVALPFVAKASSVRDATLSAYFHENTSLDDTLRSTSLSTMKPYAISYAAPANFAAAFVFGDLPPNHPHMLTRILNGSVVGIAHTTLDIEANEVIRSEEDGIPYLRARNGGNPVPLDPAITTNVGLGFIRSIDPKKQVLYIITPNHVAERLVGTNNDIILIHGVADSPGWAFREDYVTQRKQSKAISGSAYHSDISPLYIGTAKKGMQVVKSRRFKRRA